MATKSAQQEPEKAEVIEELLDALDLALDRVKVLYEQYFLGIQKQPPTYLHTDIERKIRDLAQLQIRNTALRYRFATLQQKFGSYHSYWRRTLRQIENGTYTRNLSKIGRQAARTGAEVPEEILAAMPRRMREQVKRDREAALSLARLRSHAAAAEDPEALTLADEDVEIDVDDLDPAAFIRESSDLRRNALTAGGAHQVQEADADFDLDAYFASVTSEAEPAPPRPMTGVAPGVPGVPSAPGVPVGPLRPGLAAVVARAADVVVRPAAAIGAPPSVSLQGLAPSPGAAKPAAFAPSQATRPLPIAPGASTTRVATAVETLAGPFPRIPSPPPFATAPRAAAPAPPVGAERPAPRMPSIPAVREPAPSPPGPAAVESPASPRPAPPGREPPSGPAPQRSGPVGRDASSPVLPRVAPPAGREPPAVPPPAGARRPPEPRQAPPPGMSDADVNALYAKYVKAKQILGEEAGPGAYGKLLKTINAQAPKIMEQYKSKGVEFSVIVKDNQVIIRAKPKP